MASENDRKAQQRLLNQQRRMLTSYRKQVLAEQQLSEQKYDIYKQNIQEAKTWIERFLLKSPII